MRLRASPFRSHSVPDHETLTLRQTRTVPGRGWDRIMRGVASRVACTNIRHTAMISKSGVRGRCLRREDNRLTGNECVHSPNGRSIASTVGRRSMSRQVRWRSHTRDIASAIFTNATAPNETRSATGECGAAVRQVRGLSQAVTPETLAASHGSATGVFSSGIRSHQDSRKHVRSSA